MKREDCKAGMPVLYVKGDNHVELGIIKSFNSEGVPFVCYHTGSTAACTPYHMLKPIFNEYAFQIIKKDVNNEFATQKAKRIAVKIINAISDSRDRLQDVETITDIIENYKEETK